MPPVPVIAVTTGEPAGIGPEIALRASWKLRHEMCPVLIGDRRLLEKLAAEIDQGLRLQAIEKNSLDTIRSHDRQKALPVVDCPLVTPAVPGKPDPANAKTILDTLDLAIAGTQEGLFDAVATAPVQKSVINEAGIPFTGHTEYFAEKTRAKQVVMMLAGHPLTPGGAASDELRVALATTHLPLKDVPDAISGELLTGVLDILDRELREKFAIEKPCILVSGLNPHAGENGYLGKEEIDIMASAISALRERGLNVRGPLPADTLFLPHHLKEADCFLVMYHDQGLPVLKYATFGQGVNITLGLPLIRTSVDHGTALDIAAKGTGIADHGSMQEAIRTAARMILARRKHKNAARQ